MPVTYDYDPKLNILHARPYGDLTIEDIANYFTEVSKDTVIKPGVIEVVHFDTVENFPFSSNDALSIPGRYEDLKERKNIRYTIFVGRDDIHYGVGRMFQNLLEVDDQKYDVFVVRTEEEADDLINRLKDQS